VQEVVLVLARKLDRVDARSERAFVLSTAYRVASTMRRSLRRRRETDPEPIELMIEESGTPENLLEQRRARALLDAVLENMSTDRRVVFVLYELERMTLAEIAETLQVPQGTVASRLRRARAEFELAVTELQQRLPQEGP
jgi:RNA polymerase sigma-70 factor (ECF subfamily)